VVTQGRHNVVLRGLAYLSVEDRLRQLLRDLLDKSSAIAQMAHILVVNSHHAYSRKPTPKHKHYGFLWYYDVMVS